MVFSASRAEHRSKGRVPPERGGSIVSSVDHDWRAAAAGFREPVTTRGWYLHHARIHAALLRESRLAGPVLKTDLFEEATGTHSVLDAIAVNGCATLALDLAPATVHAATRRLGPDIGALAADVLSLPLRSGTVGAVVSLSTLDHFEDPGRIREALAEIRRVLRPGGTLVVTLDNPGNPLLRLRDLLPAGLVARLRRVTFPPGATLALGDLVGAVRDTGLEVLEARPLLHAPRWVALAALRLASRLGLKPRAKRVRTVLEALERPGRSLAPLGAAHYVAVVARAPGPEA